MEQESNKEIKDDEDKSGKKDDKKDKSGKNNESGSDASNKSRTLECYIRPEQTETSETGTIRRIRIECFAKDVSRPLTDEEFQELFPVGLLPLLQGSKSSPMSQQEQQEQQEELEKQLMQQEQQNQQSSRFYPPECSETCESCSDEFKVITAACSDDFKTVTTCSDEFKTVDTSNRTEKRGDESFVSDAQIIGISDNFGSSESSQDHRTRPSQMGRSASGGSRLFSRRASQSAKPVAGTLIDPNTEATQTIKQTKRRSSSVSNAPITSTGIPNKTPDIQVDITRPSVPKPPQPPQSLQESQGRTGLESALAGSQSLGSQPPDSQPPASRPAGSGSEADSEYWSRILIPFMLLNIFYLYKLARNGSSPSHIFYVLR